MSGGNENSASTTNDLDTDIPQWKKELLQKRRNLSKILSGAHNVGNISSVTQSANTNETETDVQSEDVTVGMVHKPTYTSHSLTLSQDSITNGGHSHCNIENVQQTTPLLQTQKEMKKSKMNVYSKFNNTQTHSNDKLTEKALQLHSINEIDRFDKQSTSSGVLNNIAKCSSNKQINLVKSLHCDTNSIEKHNYNNNNNIDNNKMVAVHEIEFKNFDDTSEELKYGPGIVSKLRCRYLSLALRQTNVKQRPSLNHMRRATSLNNLLDDDDSSVSVVCDENSQDLHQNNDNGNSSEWSNKNNQPNLNHTFNSSVNNENNSVQPLFKKNTDLKDKRSRQIQRGNDSLKRARSVEALVRYDSKAWKRDITTENNDNSVLIKDILAESNKYIHSEPLVTIETKVIKARERNDPRPKKIIPLLEEKERPPPDVVKEKLRIFESTANRKSRTNSQNEVAAKVATYKSIISNEKSQTVYPKPPQSPLKKPIVPPRNIQVKDKNNSKENCSTTNDTQSKVIKQSESTMRPMSPLTIDLMGYRSPKLDSPNSNSSSLNSPQLTPVLTKTAFRIPNNTSTPRATSVQKVQTEIAPKKTVTTNNGVTSSSSIDSPITMLSKKIKSFSLDSPKNSENTTIKQNGGDISKIVTKKLLKDSESSDSDIIDACEYLNDDNDSNVRKISKQTLENISKAGDTKHFKFNNNQVNNKSHLPILNGGSQNQTLISRQQCNSNDIDTQGRQVCVIRPLIAEPKLILNDEKPSIPVVVHNIEEKQKILTTQEIEKNLINKEKSSGCGLNENCEIESAVIKTNHTTILGTNECRVINNTTVWGLSKKKPNISQEENTMVFNFTDRTVIPDYLETYGFDFIRRKPSPPKPGSPGYVYIGPAPLETSTDPDDYWSMGPPSPCNVEFENSNVIIDGKSNIRSKSKDIKHNIKFDDQLTSIFEYPSESSLMDDMIDQNLNNTQSTVNQKLIGAMPLGSAPLGNYTPIKGSLATNFELGITKSSENGTSTQKTSSNSSLLSSDQPSNELDSLQYLKPATDEQTVAWSEGSHVTDLLF